MNKKYSYFILFLTLNIGALAIGSLLMNNGPQTSWYSGLNKAPWTPPGWVFGFAWTTIMICFSFYMTKLIIKVNSLTIWFLYLLQLTININWNYVFFNLHEIFSGLVFIVMLFLIVLVFAIKYRKILSISTLLILPYLVWLSIAISLNTYIYINN